MALGGANYLRPNDSPQPESGQEARIRNLSIGDADITADIQKRKAAVIR